MSFPVVNNREMVGKVATSCLVTLVGVGVGDFVFVKIQSTRCV